jgi:hypothetical protein
MTTLRNGTNVGQDDIIVVLILRNGRYGQAWHSDSVPIATMRRSQFAQDQLASQATASAHSRGPRFDIAGQVVA